MAEKMGQQWVPRQHSMGFQRCKPIALPFRCRWGILGRMEHLWQCVSYVVASAACVTAEK